MDKECEILTLEDNQEYYLIDTLLIDNIKYLFLSNINNEKDIVIRKIIIENNEEILSGLDTEEEVLKALDSFKNKYEDLFK